MAMVGQGPAAGYLPEFAVRLDDASIAAQFARGPSPLPEPGALGLWAPGLAGLGNLLRLRWRR